MTEIGRDDSALVLGRYRLMENQWAGYWWAGLAPGHDVHLNCAVDILTAPVAPGARLGDLVATRAHTVAALQHPVLPVIHDMGMEDERVVLVYRRGATRPLTDMFERGAGGWTVERALLFVADIAEALGLAHAVGLSHGSLHAAGVLVRPDGTAVLPDLVWPRTSVGVDGVNTAPEVRAGQAPGPRADVYALGALLRRILEVIGTEADDAVLAVMRRAMAQRPEDRHPNGAVMSAALRACAIDEIGMAGDDNAPPIPLAKRAPRSVMPATTPLGQLRVAGARPPSRRPTSAYPARRRPSDVAIPIVIALTLVLWPMAHVVMRDMVGRAWSWQPHAGIEHPFGHRWHDPDAPRPEEGDHHLPMIP